MRAWVMRLLAPLRRRRFERDLDDEVRAHLDLLAEEHVRRGLDRDAARLAAQRDFGALEPIKDAHRAFMQANTGRGQMILYVRTDGDPTTIAARVRGEVWRADSSVPQFEVRTLAEEINAVVVRERLLATVSTAFSGLALLLTAIGLHGLLACLVGQRVRELAIRMALGARRSGILAMIAREAVTLVGTGALVALVVALAASRVLTRWLNDVLFGLTPMDGRTLAGAVSLLLAVAVLAASLPARRASTVDPMVALRSE